MNHNITQRVDKTASAFTTIPSPLRNMIHFPLSHGYSPDLWLSPYHNH